MARDVQGQRSDKTGIQGIFEVDEVAMIACPDLMRAYQDGLMDLDQVHGVMEMLVSNCENSFPGPAFRMVVLDPPPVKPGKNDNLAVAPEQQKPQDVATWLTTFNRRSMFGALYYPWIKVANPRNGGRPIMVPPSGHMMGLWCRTDQTRGIFKAPANDTPRGVLGLAYETNMREQELLNPLGINCIRNFASYNRGLKVWGARTLVEPDNVQWRYISVRRLISYIEKSIEMGTQWVVFEPNDQDLWARVTRTVNNFLERLWREGALFGGAPGEAFYVKCDGELNSHETMMLGRLYVEVGVCPVRPAEFVIFRVSQWAPGQ
jgi:phage tail sheath protein FI